MFDLIYRFDPTNPELDKPPLNPEEARILLLAGNQDFTELTDIRRVSRETRVVHFDPRAFGWGVSEGNFPAQAPFAAVLGCADARVPTEMVFGKGCNQLFVVPVAGNVLGNECLGSLRYAVSHFPNSLRLLVVLGHSRCGAVTEAVDLYLEPSRYIAVATDPAIRSIEEQIFIAVRVAAISLEVVYGAGCMRKPGYRLALIEVAIVLNAAWSAFCLRQEFHAKCQDLDVLFGAYDLLTQYVRLPLSPAGEVTKEENRTVSYSSRRRRLSRAGFADLHG